ncbi:carbon monoxide dehydrogenase [Minwuia thermotolerans]|uniref:Carbon monoxide dehydrogenase n=2 Tax=Minwuia thermotolerans TaxID=2056226 RepID=A0A2M9G3W9_9PROT|nr:carbon monoxide dehydrogenase [Minwuia thermotolerans]
MMKFGIGQAVTRVEDRRFTTGLGNYLDDAAPEGCLHGFVVRAPVAHARLRSIDVGAARAAPGVRAVYVGQDWPDAGLKPIPIRAALENVDGTPLAVPPRWPLAIGRVRHAGEGVAFIVAESRRAAEDATDLVEADYDELDVVTDSVAALGDGAPLLHEEARGNRAFHWSKGERAPVEKALAEAAHVAELRLVNNRIVINPMEPRGALCLYDADSGAFTLSGSIQNVFMFRTLLAEQIFGIDPAKLRVVAYDVGGGFGGKNQIQPEHALVMHAARDLAAPVKWVSDRAEGFLTDGQGRDQQTRVRLALDKDHRFTGLYVETTANLGAYLSTNGPVVPTGATASVLGGAYDIPSVYTEVRGAFTNTVPTDAYRGAGRPEACYLLERVVEIAAADLGVDSIELRRRNLIRPEKLPYRASLGHLIDSGGFEDLMDRAIANADWDGFEARKAQSAARGRIRGRGLACYLEATLGVPNEYARIDFDADGGVTLSVGTQSNGQSHETTFAQIVHEKLGVDFHRIRFRQSDTAATPLGNGHGGSRSLQLAGSAILGASDKVIEKAKALAGELLEAAAADIELRDGAFRVVGTDRSVGWDAVAEAAFAAGRSESDRGLSGDDEYTRAGNAYPNGCHIAEVEIDPETGLIDVVDYTAVDDFGRIVNPLVVRGQVMGGIVQGLGQAVLEHTVYDTETAQLVSGTFMDYAMPRADHLPATRIDFYEDAPTETSPMGVKGCGEAGTIAGSPAIVSAVCNALGLRHIDMPLTPEKVWAAARGR